MRSSIYVGESPLDEPCFQVGEDNYLTNARRECKALIAAIRKKLGPEPFGARLCIKESMHDFGTCLSVECEYDDCQEEATEYAFATEDAVNTWEEVGMVSVLKELHPAEYQKRYGVVAACKLEAMTVGAVLASKR